MRREKSTFNSGKYVPLSFSTANFSHFCSQNRDRFIYRLKSDHCWTQKSFGSHQAQLCFPAFLFPLVTPRETDAQITKQVLVSKRAAKFNSPNLDFSKVWLHGSALGLPAPRHAQHRDGGCAGTAAPKGREVAALPALTRSSPLFRPQVWGGGQGGFFPPFPSAPLKQWGSEASRLGAGSPFYAARRASTAIHQRNGWRKTLKMRGVGARIDRQCGFQQSWGRRPSSRGQCEAKPSRQMELRICRMYKLC